MIAEQAISEIEGALYGVRAKTSGLAIMSLVFGVLGPFFAGTMWILSCNDFLTANPYIIAFFSCGLAWILGFVLGIKSLKQIAGSEGQLVGREYAIAGIAISAVWMLIVFMVVFLPMIYCVNS